MAANPSRNDWYLSAAHCAVNHVRCKIRSHDSLRNLYRNGIIGNFRVMCRTEKMRDVLAQRARKRGIEPSKTIETPELWKWYIIQMAYLAEEWGVGNCGEMTASAFVYLAKWHGIKPLDYISFVGEDEALVVIGSPVQVQTNNFNEWKQGSVICDPWTPWYGPSILARERYSVNQMQSVYRHDVKKK